MIGNWNYPTSIRFGVGRIQEIPAAAAELGIQRPLIVTDPGVAALPICAELQAICANGSLTAELFTGVSANPVGANVDRGVTAFKNSDCDGVIAFGGGAGLDVGKAIALMVGQTRPLFDFEDVGDGYTRVDVNGMAPVIAVPTTSGTGSEVGRASVIIDPTTQTKKVIFHPNMLPARVICDPALTVGLPKHLTAATGMDALSHALEAWCAPGFHPAADGIALESMSLVRRALGRAVDDGTDLQARAQMMAASTMGATAFQKGLGGMHAMAHPIGAIIGAHHGLINAIVMPYVLVHNRSAIEHRIGDLARYLNLGDGEFLDFLRWVLKIRDRIGIPHTLETIGMTDAHCAQLAPMALADAAAGGNPIPLTLESLESLYRNALTGNLPVE